MIKKTTVKAKIIMLLCLGVLAAVVLGSMNYVSLRLTKDLSRQSAWANHLIQDVGNARVAQGLFLRNSSEENSVLFRKAVTKIDALLAESLTQGQYLKEFTKNLGEYKELSGEITAISMEIAEKTREQKRSAEAIIQHIREDVVKTIEQNKANALMQAEDIDANEDVFLGLNRNIMEVVERQELNLTFLLLFSDLETFETAKKDIDAELSMTLKNANVILPSLKDSKLIEVGRGMGDRLARFDQKTLELVEQWRRQQALEARLHQLSSSLESSAVAFLKANEEKIVGAQDRMGWIIILIAGVVSVALLGFGILVVRSIVGVLGRVIEGLLNGSGQVASAAGQVSSSSQSLAEGTSEQAASIEETSSSLEEMASMTRRNSDNAAQANSLVNEVARNIEGANGTMVQLTTSMSEIAKASDETSKIIKTIDEIAFQTNLLALNAAVEAARAGEAGAGFAVVADEVRNLAIRAADAAKNTTELIEGTVHRVEEGSALVTNTNEAFGKVSANVRKVVGLVSEIASASMEQSTGIEQVNNAVAEMDRVIQHNAANAEESSGASEELNAQADQLKGFVEELVSLVGNTARHEKQGKKEQLALVLRD